MRYDLNAPIKRAPKGKRLFHVAYSGNPLMGVHVGVTCEADSLKAAQIEARRALGAVDKDDEGREEFEPGPQSITFEVMPGVRVVVWFDPDNPKSIEEIVSTTGSVLRAPRKPKVTKAKPKKG